MANKHSNRLFLTHSLSTFWLIGNDHALFQIFANLVSGPCAFSYLLFDLNASLIKVYCVKVKSCYWEDIDIRKGGNIFWNGLHNILRPVMRLLTLTFPSECAWNDGKVVVRERRRGITGAANNKHTREEHNRLRAQHSEQRLLKKLKKHGQKQIWLESIYG